MFQLLKYPKLGYQRFFIMNAQKVVQILMVVDALFMVHIFRVTMAIYALTLVPGEKDHFTIIITV